MKLSLKDKLMAISACLLWSTAFVGIKTGLCYFPPIIYAGIRFFLAGIVIFPFWIFHQRKRRSIKGCAKFILLVGFWQTFLLYFLFYSGLKNIPASVGSIINGTAPLMVAFFAGLLFPAQKVNSKLFFTLLLGVSGVGLVVWGKSSSGIYLGKDMTFLKGVCMVLAATAVSASGNVFISFKRKDIDPVALNSIQFIVGGSILFLVGIYREDLPPLPGEITFYYVTLWLVILSATAFSIWFSLLQKGSCVSEMNVWKFIIPVAGAIWSWIFINNDSPSFFQFIGMLCVAFAIVFYYKEGRKKINMK